MHLTDNGWLHGTAQVFEPAVVLKPENVSIGAHSRIDSFVKIEGGDGVSIGRWVHISSFAHLNIGGGKLIIGNGVACTSGTRILSGSNTPRGLYMSSAAKPEDQDVKRMTTTLEEGAFIGANAVVLPGITVGRFAVVGAGAVVTHDVPDHEIWMGVPARKVEERDR